MGFSCRQPFDVFVHPGHHAMLVGVHSAFEVVNDIRRKARRFQRFGIGFDRDVLEDDLAVQRFGELRPI
jgi:hypothetical protein